MFLQEFFLAENYELKFYSDILTLLVNLIGVDTYFFMWII